ncbi:MAG: glycosyltransferase family 2 protein [Bdellovibrionales bacterium]|nr:glycosyltransferase family 2 protein [Bdellovibrionales bacterium]
MKVYGFSYIRNGDTIGYPYFESFQCLSEFCDHIYIAVGDSTDGTRAKVASLPNVTIIDTVWSENQRKHGHIFSIQANAALDELRRHHNDGWAFHLQADQIIFRDDFAKLKKDFELADQQNCDGMSLRFNHFWQNMQQLVYTKKWYPDSIMATKVNSAGKSVGDSQSLGNCTQVYHSDVNIFHYSHALGENYRLVKRKALSRWWHSDENIEKDVQKFFKRTANEPTLAYLGKHPQWVQSRFNTHLEPVESAWIVGSHPELENCRSKIGAKKVNLVSALGEVPSPERKNAVILYPNLWQKFLYPSQVPKAMHWPNARPWTFEFWLIMKLSEKGIPYDLGGG